MVQDLGIHERDASFYSGLLVSAYAIAEAITGETPFIDISAYRPERFGA